MKGAELAGAVVIVTEAGARQAATGSECGKDCGACPKRLTCPFAPRADETTTGGSR